MQDYDSMDENVTDAVANQSEQFKLLNSPTRSTETHSSGSMSIKLVLDSDNDGSDTLCNYTYHDSDECMQTDLENISDGDITDDEELIISNQRVENSIDDVIEELTGASLFQWARNFDTFKGTREIFTGPKPGPVQDYDSVYDAFTDIWSDNILTLIVDKTNQHAKQTISYETQMGTLKPESSLHQWKETNTDELLRLFAINIVMGIVIRPTVEYWSTDDCGGMRNFDELLSMNKYRLLMEFLHFVDNSSISLDTQQTKVNPTIIQNLLPIIDLLNAKFSTLYNLQSEISIDESLTLFNGRSSRRSKIKSFGICESVTGYLHKFQIYMEKDSRISLGAPGNDLESNNEVQIVLKLLQDMHKLGHLVTLDSRFNSPALVRYLKASGFDCLGLLSCNRRNIPEVIHKLFKGTSSGKMVWRHCGDVSLVAWVDRKPVGIISTYHQMETYVDKSAGKRVRKPTGVLDYNQIMAGTYHRQRRLMEYDRRNLSPKWYLKIFWRLLDLSIYNAFVMFASSQRRRNLASGTYREFRKRLATEIVVRHRKLPEMPEQVDVDTRLRRDIDHEPGYSKGKAGRKRCFICYRRKKSKFVHSQCVTCNVYLCFGVCWAKWHSQQTLIGGNRIKRIKPRQ